MVSIVDYYQSLVAPRDSSLALSTMEAVNEINQCKDREFQSALVDNFVQSIGIYSTGSIVELSTGEIGFVVSQHPIKKLKPQVMLVMDKDKRELSRFPIVNLDVVNYDRNNNYLKIVKTHLSNEYNLDFTKYISA
jgi:hypothetical protein